MLQVGETVECNATYCYEQLVEKGNDKDCAETEVTE